MFKRCAKHWVSECICVLVCKYFLIVIGTKDVDRTNNAYRTLFQSIQNDNYNGQIHHSKYIFRVYMGSEHMGHSLKHTRQCSHFMQ
jgi:hypothetical protein